MGKKTTTYRVHQLAKELGVSSRDIVAKCQAEDVPDISNHMSTVSHGLAQTVREWFTGVAASATAVETAAPVDVEQARSHITKRATRKKAVEVGTPEAPPVADGTATAVAEPPAVEKMAARSRTPGAQARAGRGAPDTAAAAAIAAPSEPVGPAEPAVSIVIEPPARPAAPPAAPVHPPVAPETPDEELAPAAVAPPAAPSRQRHVTPAPQNVPDRPQVIAPAGPKLEAPKKARMSGPKVIRVETPEYLPAPAPRSRAGGPGGGPGRWAPGAPAPADPASPARGRQQPQTSRRNKRRSASAREETPRTGRLSVPGAEAERPFNWREQDLLERERRLNRSGGFFRAARRDNLKRSSGGGQRAATAAESGGSVRVAEPLTVKTLSAATGVKTADILKKLLLSGKEATINSRIDTGTAIEIMMGYNIQLEVTEQKTAEEQIVRQFQEREMLDERRRSPVVTILGHVDHGKTSLLDRIRNTNIAAGEAGGITQATRAFQVPVRSGEDGERTVCFIDTPGHEAFTEMRARGARVTDVVVLVVAADDGVMPQTVESISHARQAGVPIVVALNKIDKPEANEATVRRILGQLAEHDLNPVEWGGTVEVVKTSAISGQGIEDLLEVLDYQAELLDLKADFDGPAEGTVIEARLEEGRGAVANILVQRGKLERGAFIVAGRAYGRVRDMVNDRGERVDEAGPSMPIAFSGLGEVPDAGDKFYVVKSLKEAESAARERQDQERQRDLASEKITLHNIFEKLSEAGKKELPLIVKGDVQGSVDTLRTTLQKIATKDVGISIKHAAVGGINESDVLLAETSGAIILGFNVTAPGKARKLAEAKGVDIRLYDVIYDLLDDVKLAAEGLLEPEYRLEVLGHAEVRQVFRISRVGAVAGCYVTDGVIERNSQIRVTRGGIVVEKDRRLEQLRRFKDDVKEVKAGQECGMRIDGYDDVKEGDVLECYKTLTVKRTL